MAHSTLNYDPTRRYDFKVEDVEYRRDSEQSWLAMVYQPQGSGPFPAPFERSLARSVGARLG